MAIERSDIQRKPGMNLALPSFHLLELNVFCKFFVMERKTALKFFRAMNVPLLHVGQCAYYSEYTLEKAIYVITRPGGLGFAAPGSTKKHQGCDLPKDFRGQAKKDFIDPALAIEMVAARNRDMPSALKAMAVIRGKKKK